MKFQTVWVVFMILVCIGLAFFSGIFVAETWQSHIFSAASNWDPSYLYNKAQLQKGLVIFSSLDGDEAFSCGLGENKKLEAGQLP